MTAAAPVPEGAECAGAPGPAVCRGDGADDTRPRHHHHRRHGKGGSAHDRRRHETAPAAVAAAEAAEEGAGERGDVPVHVAEVGWAWRQRQGADASSNAASAMSPVTLAEGLSELSLVELLTDNSPLKHDARRSIRNCSYVGGDDDGEEDDEGEEDEDESLATCTQTKNDDNTCAEPAITTVASGSEDEPSLDLEGDSLAWTEDSDADADADADALLLCGTKRVPVTVRCARHLDGHDTSDDEDDEDEDDDNDDDIGIDCDGHGRRGAGTRARALRGLSPSELTSTVAGSVAEKDITEEASDGFGSCDECTAPDLASMDPAASPHRTTPPPRFVVTPVVGAAAPQLPTFGTPIVPGQEKTRPKGAKATKTKARQKGKGRRLFVDEECQESASARESKPFSRMNRGAYCSRHSSLSSLSAPRRAHDEGGCNAAHAAAPEDGADAAPLTPSSSVLDEGAASTMSRDDAVEALLRARLENSFQSTRSMPQRRPDDNDDDADDRRERAEPKHRTGLGSIFKRFSTKKDKAPVPAPVFSTVPTAATTAGVVQGDAAGAGAAEAVAVSGEQEQQQQQQEPATAAAAPGGVGDHDVEDCSVVENDHPHMGKRNKSVPSFTAAAVQVQGADPARRQGDGSTHAPKTHGTVNRSLDMTRKDKADARRRYEDNLYETEEVYAVRLETIVELFLAPLQQQCALASSQQQQQQQQQQEPGNDRPAAVASAGTTASAPGTPTAVRSPGSPGASVPAPVPEPRVPVDNSTATAAPAVAAPCLSEGEIRAVFGNLGALAACHRTVVAQMQQCAAARRSVLHALAAQGSELAKLYTSYIQGFSAATRATTELLARSRAFAAFAQAAERDPRCEGLVLHSLLFSPLQRVMRYVTLLNACDAFTPKDDPLKRPIKRVLKKMRDLSEGMFKDLEEDAARANQRRAAAAAAAAATAATAAQEREEDGSVLKRGTLYRLDAGEDRPQAVQAHLVHGALVCTTRSGESTYRLGRREAAATGALETGHGTVIVVAAVADGADAVFVGATEDDTRAWLSAIAHAQQQQQQQHCT